MRSGVIRPFSITLLLSVVVDFGHVNSPADAANFVITEVQSNESPNAGVTANDFWELTNLSGSPLDISGWRWDDDENDPNGVKAVTFPASTIINPGTSTIVTGGSLSAADFRTWWGIDSSVQVISTAGPGLGQNDQVNLWQPSGATFTKAASINYAAAGFTKSDGSPSAGGHAGISAGGSQSFFAAIWDPTTSSDSPRYTFAVAGQFGAFKAGAGSDVGSPGVVNAVPEPSTIVLAAMGLLAAIGLTMGRQKPTAMKL